MKNLKIRNTILLLLTALIWGIAFVAQTSGGDLLGPYTFNGTRAIIGSVVLLPVIFITNKAGRVKTEISEEEARKSKKTLLISGGLCGLVLFLASSTQQLSMYYGTSAGKAGFLTACYIILVPILGIFLKKECGINVWFAVLLSLLGLYLLCINGEFVLQKGDALCLISALCFSLHILVIDYFTERVNGVKLSCLQFLVCGILCLICAYIFEISHDADGFASWIHLFDSIDAWIPLLYAGVLSCGVAYTLQIIGQKGMNPTIASLIMSLESVFSVLAGFLILNQKLSGKEIIGCVVMFIAIILAQVPWKRGKND